ncbi:hypothetical protein KKH27_07985, partial [bacterium]|nr:hypothetical protein [bacterium]
DSMHVTLRWSAVAGADSYRVYRADDAAMTLPEWILTTAETFAVDTLDGTPLPEDSSRKWFYQVTTVGSP